jgi:hypothetical protein
MKKVKVSPTEFGEKTILDFFLIKEKVSYIFIFS